MLTLNIDESSLNDFSGRMKRWLLPNDKLVQVADKPRSRVCMICSVDTVGRVFYSLSYVNTNKFVFCRFLYDLAEQYRIIGCPKALSAGAAASNECGAETINHARKVFTYTLTTFELW